MAASDDERSTPTILRKSEREQWTWTVYSHHDAVVKVTTKRKTELIREDKSFTKLSFVDTIIVISVNLVNNC